jgi:hypothetical protein
MTWSRFQAMPGSAMFAPRIARDKGEDQPGPGPTNG